jgi:hypothetical protein
MSFSVTKPPERGGFDEKHSIYSRHSQQQSVTKHP